MTGPAEDLPQNPREVRGHDSGPDAPIRATAAALEAAESARSVVLVEGISDQIALETLASLHGRDLDAERVVVLPIGGAQAASKYLMQFGPQGAGTAIAGMCDIAEERFFRIGIAACGLGSPRDRDDMERLGFFVCVKDLEQELIRAWDQPAIESLLESKGDLGSLRTFQKQSAWRDQPFENQMHRWLRAGATRNLRYARLLIRAPDPDRIPRPLLGVLAATASQ